MRRELRGETVPKLVRLSPGHRAKTSERQSGLALYPQPCKQHPFLRRRASRQRGNGRWFAQSERKNRPLDAHLKIQRRAKSTKPDGLGAKVTKRLEVQIAPQNRPSNF